MGFKTDLIAKSRLKRPSKQAFSLALVNVIADYMVYLQALL